MKTSLVTLAATAALIAAAVCAHPPLPRADSPLLDPKGGFTLFVSNQSFDISPVDVGVEIDGGLVVSGYFDVGNQHVFKPFKLALRPGRHKIRVWSKKGDAELSKEFDLKAEDVGVIQYWFYPKTHYSPTRRRFTFNIQRGPLAIH